MGTDPGEGEVAHERPAVDLEGSSGEPAGTDGDAEWDPELTEQYFAALRDHVRRDLDARVAGPRPWDDFTSDRWPGEPRMVTFFIPLPVPLPLPHRRSYTFELDEEVEWLKPPPGVIPPGSPPIPYGEKRGDYETLGWISPEGLNRVYLQIWRPKETLTIPTELFYNAMGALYAVTGVPAADPSRRSEGLVPLPGAESYGTVVRAETLLSEAPGRGWWEAVSIAFDRCLEKIETLRRAYSVATGDVHARPITRQNLYPAIPFTTTHPAEHGWSEPGVFAVNESLRLATAREHMSDEALERTDIYLGRLVKRDPLALSLDWARLAEQALELDGDYRSAVTAVHTACEVLFDAMLLMMGWEEGLEPRIAARWFDVTLAKRLRTHYPSRLGGVWQPTPQGSVIGRWLERVSYVRNRVAHAGYVPDEAEARGAMESYYELNEFFKDRLCQKLDTYRRPALLLLGVPGLERRGLYGGAIKTFVETQLPTEEEPLVSYRRWADEVRALREPSGG